MLPLEGAGCRGRGLEEQSKMTEGRGRAACEGRHSCGSVPFCGWWRVSLGPEGLRDWWIGLPGMHRMDRRDVGQGLW